MTIRLLLWLTARFHRFSRLVVAMAAVVVCVCVQNIKRISTCGMEREKPVYSQSNQLTNQPKNETQFNPMSIISRCYSNGFVGFFIYSLAWLLTHPSVEWFSIQRGRERESAQHTFESCFDGQKAYHQVFFFFFLFFLNWNYYHRSSTLNTMGTKQTSFSLDIC